MNRYLQEQAKDAICRKLRSGTWNLGDVFSSWQSDSSSNWCSIQVRSLVGTRSCHHDRGSPTMEWTGALHDRTNWCRLGVARKQTHQMSSHAAPQMMAAESQYWNAWLRENTKESTSGIDVTSARTHRAVERSSRRAPVTVRSIKTPPRKLSLPDVAGGRGRSIVPTVRSSQGTGEGVRGQK